MTLNKKRIRIWEHKNKLREISDSVKCNKIHIIGVPEEEERRRGQKIYLRK